MGPLHLGENRLITTAHYAEIYFVASTGWPGWLATPTPTQLNKAQRMQMQLVRQAGSGEREGGKRGRGLANQRQKPPTKRNEMCQF